MMITTEIILAIFNTVILLAILIPAMLFPALIAAYGEKFVDIVTFKWLKKSVDKDSETV